MTRRQIIEWRQRIIEAEERYAQDQDRGALFPEGFTQEDKRDASGWEGCAVGEAYANSGKKMRLIIAPILEGEDAGEYFSGPNDRVLQRLGGEFSTVVDRNDFLRAYEIIDLIEARVLHLRYKRG